MTDVIEQLEAAAEGNRELDRLIADIMGTVEEAHDDVCLESRSIVSWPDIFPHYTTSLDAAIALVPEIVDEWFIGGPLGGEAKLSNDSDCWDSYAETPALAICIAALKARAHD